MPRRGKGEGTIHKRPNGSWRAQVTIEGQRLSYSAKSRKECQKWLKETIAQVDRGLSYQAANVTMDEYLTRWLISKESSIQPSTYAHYKILTEKYLIPRFGDVPVRSLRADQIQHEYDNMLQEGIGKPTIIKTHAVLHNVLERATKTGVTFRNAASLVSPPAKEEREITFWSEGEANRFLTIAYSSNNRLYALFYLAIVTGMRQMELAGLQWRDLDWIKKTINIQRQLARQSGVMFSPLKTRASKRTIRLGEGTISVLRNHMQQQNEDRMIAGDDRWQEHGLIFTSTIGTPINHKNLVDRNFKPLIVEANVPPIRFHDLRHTAASIMLSHGRPLIVVSKILGHSRTSITADVYGHLIPGIEDLTADLMDELVSPVELPNLSDISTR